MGLETESNWSGLGREMGPLAGVAGPRRLTLDEGGLSVIVSLQASGGTNPFTSQKSGVSLNPMVLGGQDASALLHRGHGFRRARTPKAKPLSACGPGARFRLPRGGQG